MESPQVGVPSVEMVNGNERPGREEDGQARGDIRLPVLADAPPPASDHWAAGVGSPQEWFREVAAGSSSGGDQRSDRGAEEELSRATTGVEERIRILLRFKQKGNEVYMEAFEAWEKERLHFETRIDSHRVEANSVKNEIYQLIGFYSVFQGVILTAVAQSSLLVCRNWWSTFFLSLLASLVAVVGVIQKFLTLRSLGFVVYHLQAALRDVERRLAYLTMKGPDKFSFERDTRERRRLRFTSKRLQVSLVAVVATLLLFSGLLLASVYQILCHSGLPV